ncbi:hypothetical protein QJQ45_000693 [Haematococcus lacustris]|nr:hypothetical protein QJQ45_000693 [Haematococcus lacustris]
MLAVRVFVVALTLALASAQADILALHNGYRRAHQVPPLTSSAALTSAAQSWANRLAASCTFEHARGTGQGENLASGHRSWTEVARGWYNEVRQYNYGAPGFGMSTGHFTQMASGQEVQQATRCLASKALSLAPASHCTDCLARQLHRRHVITVRGICCWLILATPIILALACRAVSAL